MVEWILVQVLETLTPGLTVVTQIFAHKTACISRNYCVSLKTSKFIIFDALLDYNKKMGSENFGGKYVIMPYA